MLIVEESQGAREWKHGARVNTRAPRAPWQVGEPPGRQSRQESPQGTRAGRRATRAPEPGRIAPKALEPGRRAPRAPEY